MKQITKHEAYEMYLEGNYELIMPFISRIEEDFVSFLKHLGIEVILEEAPK